MCVLELDVPVVLAAHLWDGGFGMQLDPGSQHSALFQVDPHPDGGLWVGIDLDWLQVCSCSSKELSGLVWGAVLLCIPGIFSLWVSEESACTEGE